MFQTRFKPMTEDAAYGKIRNAKSRWQSRTLATPPTAHQRQVDPFSLRRVTGADELAINTLAERPPSWTRGQGAGSLPLTPK